MKFKMNKDSNFNFFYFIGLAILIVSFIITTFFDYEITAWFGKGMDFYFLRQLVNFVSAGGNFVIIIPLFIVGAVFFETIYKKFAIKNNALKLVPYLLLIISVIFFGALYCIQKASYNFIDDIKNNSLNSIWMKTLTTWTEPIIVCSIWIVIMTIILIFGTLYFRKNFSRRDDILESKYWIGAIQMLVLGILTYFIVLVLKQALGRPFYYSVIYKDLFGITGTTTDDLLKDLTLKNYDQHTGAKLLIDEYFKAFPNLERTEKNLEKIVKPWMVETLVKSEYGPAPENASDWSYWFTPNGFFKNMFRWIPLVNKTALHYVNPETNEIIWSDQWWNNDFPSGHIAASIINFGIIFIFRRNEKVNFKNPKIFAILTTFSFYTILTFFFMIVYRFHWITEMLFTPIIFLCFLPLVNNKTEKCIYRIILKFRNNKEVKVRYKEGFIQYCILFNNKYETFKVIKSKKKAYKYEYKLKVKYRNLQLK